MATVLPNGIGVEMPGSITPVGAHAHTSGRFQLLDPEQQEHLAQRVAIGGSYEDRVALVLHNLRLVTIAVGEITVGRLNPDDIQRGVIGLIMSTHSYEPGRGRFSAHASEKIKREVQRSRDNEDDLLRIPVHAQTTLRDMARNAALFQQEMQRPPSYTEVVEMTRKDWAEVGFIHAAARPYLDLFFGASENDSPFEELVADPRINVEDETFRRAATEVISDILETLDERTRTIIKYRFGIGGYELHKYKEIGIKVGLSPKRVQEIISKTLKEIAQERPDLRHFIM